MPTIQWMTSIPITESVCLHAFLQSANVKLSIQDDLVWLRGEAESEEGLIEIDQRLRTIPGAERFVVVNTNLLQPIGSLLPTTACPDGPWQSPSALLCVDLPAAGLSGQNPGSVRINVVRTATAEANSKLTPTVLECDFDSWRQWALHASEVRLGALAFACNATGMTLVRGTPLPPLAGKRWIEYGNVAVEIGHSWKPSVSVETLNRSLETTSEAIHFLENDGRLRVLDRSSFVLATRSSVRATAESIGSAL